MLYRLNDRRLAAEKGSAAFAEADGCLRQAVAEMKTQMETELARADLATPCRKVLESLRAHWDGLTLFVDDPRIPMDNNTSERLARGPAVARKNFYGSGSQWSGQLAAALFSIFATLSMWKLNPRKWLTWYFEQCAAAGGKVPENIQPFLPWNLSEETKKELGEPGTLKGTTLPRSTDQVHPGNRISATTRGRASLPPRERWAASCCALNKRDGRSFTVIGS